MSSSKSKSSKHDKPPDDVDKLIGLIIGEVQSPIDMQKLVDEMPRVVNCSAEAMQLVKAKDRAQRREAFIRNEAIWYRKYGWFMARIVILFGLLVAIAAFFLRGAGIEFVISMITGAAGYYLLLTTASNIRYRDKNRKRRMLIEEERQKYQREVTQIAASLMKRFNVDPTRYPVSNPSSGAGLEHREGGFFIPVD
jgi:hypothetical protein